MPAFSTHYIFAKELLPELKELTDEKIIDEVVFVGSQGADIFFFHRVLPTMPGKSLRKIGSMIHRSKPSELFECMLEYAESCEYRDIIMSYIYGFVMHYALDRRCHPFVYSLQDKLTKTPLYRNPHTAHNVIEFAMDSYLLVKRLNITEPEKFNTADTIKVTAEECEIIGALLEYTVKKLFDISIDSKVARAFADTKAVQKITLDKTGVKKAFISILDIPISIVSGGYKFSAMLRPKDLEKAKKYGNINSGKWKSPFDNTISSSSFEELFELAKTEAIEMIAGIINGDDIKDITNNLSFLTGVEVK